MSGTGILDRFRPIGAPGAAGSMGVPVSELRGAEAELAPVFAALASEWENADAVVAQATAAAAKARADAAERAADIVAAAQRSAPADQAAAAERIATAAAVADAQLQQAALVEAAAVRRKGARRLPALLRRTQDELLKEIG
jgi:3-hydroxyacyl-CoA dehydrogenase